MFTTLIVQPIFNLLVLIYAILPWHNFGMAIIIFTIIVRLLMWPLVKKQLHQAKAMRELQPEIKKIKKAAAGNKQKESTMLMELYKEKEINPFFSLGLVLLQIPFFIGLYSGLRRLVLDPTTIITFTYPFVRELTWIRVLSNDIHQFDATLFGFVDLTRAAIGKAGIYWPAMFIVVASAITQYFQSKQLLPDSKDSRGLRKILKDASSGRKAEQGEINAAVGKTTRYFLPVMIFVITVNIASALSLYWLTSGIVAFIQQSRVLGKDEEEMEAIADAPSGSGKKIIEGEIVNKKQKKETRNKKQTSKKRKRKKK